MGWSNIWREKEETYYGDYRINFVQPKMVWPRKMLDKQFGSHLNNCLFVHYISNLKKKYTNLCVWSILILWIWVLVDIIILSVWFTILKITKRLSYQTESLVNLDWRRLIMAEGRSLSRNLPLCGYYVLVTLVVLWNINKWENRCPKMSSNLA